MPCDSNTKCLDCIRSSDWCEEQWVWEIGKKDCISGTNVKVRSNDENGVYNIYEYKNGAWSFRGSGTGTNFKAFSIRGGRKYKVVGSEVESADAPIVEFTAVSNWLHCVSIDYVPAKGSICGYCNIPNAIISVTDAATHTRTIEFVGTTKSCQSNQTPETYVAYFEKKEGYATPPPQTKTLAPNGEITFYGEYILAKEEEICAYSNIEDGAVTVYDSDNTEVLSVMGTTKDCIKGTALSGTYTAKWAHVTGYNTPEDQVKTVENGGSITFYGEYTEADGTICANSNIEEGAVSVYDSKSNKVLDNVGITEQCTTVKPDSYTAKWLEVEGYKTPKDQVKDLVGEGAISFYGEYTEVPEVTPLETPFPWWIILLLLLMYYLSKKR